MKITAVVVTFNRFELLKKGIAQLRQQPELTQITVVDNSSSDGTGSWLDVQADLDVVHQPNIGGSGGFYTGIRRAYEQGADWVWCMDDDVFPRLGCLKELLRVATTTGAGIVAPHRLMDGKTFTHEFQRFNFHNPVGSLHDKKLRPADIDAAKGDTIPIIGCDFEGPFISRKVISSIGLPNKELFIFCDDTDYCLRAHLAGFAILFAKNALFDKHKFFSDDTWTIRNQKKKWKRYYHIRNEAYLNHHYGLNWGVRYGRSLMAVTGFIVPAVLSMPFFKAWRWRDIGMLWGAYIDGINERLGKRELQ